MSKIEARMLTHTEHPAITVWLEWMQSRSDAHIPSAQAVYEKFQVGAGPQEVVGENITILEIGQFFDKMCNDRLPLLETIEIVFLLENIPISLREQLVRHRIGHRFGQTVGVDIIPDLAESTFWSQTMRVKDMAGFATRHDYYIPESINESKTQVPWDHRSPRTLPLELYEEAMMMAQSVYSKLIGAGIPLEDARQVLPLGITHRFIWRTNLASIIGLLSKRTCWLAQLGMWKPLMVSVVKELGLKISPILRSNLLSPPCMKGDEHTGCPYLIDAMGRLIGTDPLPPCPLFCRYHQADIANHFSKLENRCLKWCVLGEDEPQCDDIGSLDSFQKMVDEFSELWNRDPMTGHRR